VCPPWSPRRRLVGERGHGTILPVRRWALATFCRLPLLTIRAGGHVPRELRGQELGLDRGETHSCARFWSPAPLGWCQ
jgi:hypothetical protein